MSSGFYSALYKKWQLNDASSLFWTKSWKPLIIGQYDTQRQRIKRLIVLLFLKAPWIFYRNVPISQNVSISHNAQGSLFEIRLPRSRGQKIIFTVPAENWDVFSSGTLTRWRLKLIWKTKDDLFLAKNENTRAVRTYSLFNCFNLWLRPNHLLE